MTPGTKGLLAATAFCLVHTGIIAVSAAVIAAETDKAAPATSSAAPASKPALTAALAPAAIAVAQSSAPAPAAIPAAPQAAQTQAAAPRPAKALEERRFALTFLTDLANGKREEAYGKLARETRDTTTLKAFDKAFAPIADLGLEQVTWGKITERRAVNNYTSATGYTKSPSVTALEGTATSASGPVRIEFTLVDNPGGWQIQHFRFKAERRQKSASR